MPTDTPYTIADLARLTGVTPRTVRYYVAQGLLPGPDATGRGAHYDDGHLARLQLTRRLQRQHLPLAEIRARLSTMTEDEIANLATPDPESPSPSTSALEYIRTVLQGTPTADAGHVRARLASEAFPASGPSPMASPLAFDPSDSGTAVTTPPPEPPSLERSQWERLSLGPNVELHIRRPLSRHEQRRVDRLITIARQVLKEGQP
jgi:DNA-binding transcriptional MerR regulator